MHTVSARTAAKKTTCATRCDKCGMSAARCKSLCSRSQTSRLLGKEGRINAHTPAAPAAAEDVALPLGYPPRSRWGARDRADRARAIARARRGKKRNEIPIYTHGTLVS